MSPELTAVMRLAVFATTLCAILVYGFRRGRIDWLGVAVLACGMTLAGAVGLGLSRPLEGALRMPSTLLVCAYVLLAQRRA